MSFKPQVMPTNKPEQAMLKIKYSISCYFTHFKKNRKYIIKVTAKKVGTLNVQNPLLPWLKWPVHQAFWKSSGKSFENLL